jgi:hypothetical protein
MRKPVDVDSQIKALQDKAKALKERHKTQLGELVLATGADTLPPEALAGVLLAAVEQARQNTEAVARWTERGQAFFQRDSKQSARGKRNGASDPTPGSSNDSAPAQAGSNPAP